MYSFLSAVSLFSTFSLSVSHSVLAVSLCVYLLSVHAILYILYMCNYYYHHLNLWHLIYNALLPI